MRYIECTLWYIKLLLKAIYSIKEIIIYIKVLNALTR
jgi:hypothetical protein